MSMLGRVMCSQNIRKCIYFSRGSAVRFISTSKKNSDTTTVEAPTTSSVTDECSTSPSKPKNWMSYGFSTTDQNEDTNQMHALLFFGVTIALVFTGFTLAYRPDDLMRDWAQREGFLELRRREAAGLPRVDANYIPVDSIVLPSDEELGDTEIII